MQRGAASTKPQRWCILVLVMLGLGQRPVCGKQLEKRGVMDNFNEGLKFAGQMFGINTAADVANLVAKAFSTTRGTTSNENGNGNGNDLISTLFQHRRQPSPNRYGQQQQEPQATGDSAEDPNAEGTASAQQGNAESSTHPHNTKEVLPTEEPFLAPNVITNVLRMIGFDARKLGALAINALIMIAQAIGNSLMTATTTRRASDAAEPPADYGSEHQPRELRAGSPIDWLLEQSPAGMTEMFAEMTADKLSDRLTAMIEGMERQGGGAAQQQAACLKMLMCKSSPLIWGMQRSVKERLQKRSSASAANEGDGSDTNRQRDGQTSIFNASVFFAHLPTIDEYRAHGQQCERRYAGHCNTTRLIHDE